MEQHPIPQQISSYEFRLVGDMTLKQFLKLAGGVLMAYLVYNSNLLLILRFPAALIFLLLGIGMAFFPINEKPLEFWLITFLKAIYSPTIYIWKKPLFRQSASKPPPPKTVKQVIRPQVQSKVLVKSAPLSTPTTVTPKTKRGGVASQTPPSSPGVKIAEMIKHAPRKPRSSAPPDFLEDSLPAAPTIPNIINGLVVDEKKRILEGVIVEIQDVENNPIRAMRTNALGQFQTATPLPNGKYFILAEKEPYHFDIIKIEAGGKIILPLKIQAKKQLIN